MCDVKKRVQLRLAEPYIRFDFSRASYSYFHKLLMNETRVSIRKIFFHVLNCLNAERFICFDMKYTNGTKILNEIMRHQSNKYVRQI